MNNITTTTPISFGSCSGTTTSNIGITSDIMNVIKIKAILAYGNDSLILTFQSDGDVSNMHQSIIEVESMSAFSSWVVKSTSEVDKIKSRYIKNKLTEFLDEK